MKALGMQLTASALCAAALLVTLGLASGCKDRTTTKETASTAVTEVTTQTAEPATQAAQTSQPATQPAKPDGLVRFFKNLQAGKKQTLVTWGTSLTAPNNEWVVKIDEYMKQNYPGQVTVINSGISGSCLEIQGVPLLKDAVLDKKPDVVIAEFAINDSYLPYVTSLDECRSLLNQMIDGILKANPQCVIVLQTMNPCFGDAGRQRPNLAAYYQVYREVAKERKLDLVDHYVVWQALIVKDSGLFNKYVPDQLHPQGEGNTLVVWPDIQAAFEVARQEAGYKPAAATKP